MFEHYLAALLSLRQARDLAYSAPPDTPVQPGREDGDAEATAPAGPPIAAGPNRSSAWVPCPCRQWGVARADHHGCVALVKELFPQLDQELDAWEAEHGWLYH
jgi:hypothetical protein